jgi:ankyrin repeat protein
MAQADESLIAALIGRDEAGAIKALRRGADPRLGARLGAGGEVEELRGDTPLAIALRSNLPRLASMLLAGSDLLHADSHGWSVLGDAAAAGHMEVLRAAAAVDDPRATRHPGGVTALMQAAERGHMEAIEFLVPLSDLAARDRFGLGALEWAAKGRSLEAVDFMLTAGLPVDPPGSGSSALMVAASRNRAKLVRRLLPLGDPWRRGGATAVAGPEDAVGMALESDAWECVDLLAALAPARRAREALDRGLAEGAAMPATRAALAAWEARELSAAIGNGSGKGRGPLSL